MKIFEDSRRSDEISYNLIENRSYILDFESENETLISNEIYHSNLSNFINWQKGNRYGTLCISNYIGHVHFYKKTFDVKSSKFLTTLSGTEQFKTLLNDIENMSKNILFTYDSPSFAVREVDYKDANPTTLLIFNYFKKIILDWDSTINLNTSINRILNNPNFKYRVHYQKDRIEKLRKVDNKIIKLLLNKPVELAIIENENENILDLPLTRFLSSKSSKNYFPTKAYTKNSLLNYDTLENRFVKYFIRYILSFTYKLNLIKNLPLSVVRDKELILNFCQKILNKPFFRKIGEMNIVPVNSSVLLGRTGYKDIHSHYIKSRFGINHLFENFHKDSLSIGLKKISDLYEYWVFYRIARAFLGEAIIIEQVDEITQDGNISNAVCFKNSDISVFYNKSESKSKKTSYSLNLRPDTTVTIQKGNSRIKFIFDAKYKVKIKTTDSSSERHVKPEDIHKMHAYVDAIEDAKFAFVVYPGTEFYFFERNLNSPVRESVDDIELFEGVGALNLTPDNQCQYEQLDKLVLKILSSI